MVSTDSPDRKKARTDDGGGDDKWTLKPHRTIKPPTKESPLLVVVLDGWGAACSTVLDDRLCRNMHRLDMHAWMAAYVTPWPDACFAALLQAKRLTRTTTPLRSQVHMPLHSCAYECCSPARRTHVHEDGTMLLL